MRVVIADDERFARQRIRSLLASEHSIEIVAECANGSEAASLLQQQPVDLVFLDIEMPGMNGFEVLPQLGSAELPLIVFITAYEQHALQAFRVKAFDYLLKPVDPVRFKETVQRARLQIARLKSEPPASKTYRERFAIRKTGRISFMLTDSVDWIEADHNHVRLHSGKETQLIRSTLNEVEAELDPQVFRRIHRSIIVNVKRIQEVQPWFRGDCMIVLTTGEKLNMSRTYRPRLEDFLG